MRVRPFVREAGWELPSSLDVLIPADHPVRFVAAYLDSLTPAEWEDLGMAFVVGGQGSHGYHPKVLLGAWIWGFMSGVRSSRRIEGACRERLPVLWLTGGQQPDHNTLNRFYREHRPGMRVLLTHTVRTAVRLGLVDLAIQAIDGTKVAGNAARARSYDAAGLERLLARTQRAIDALEAQNEADDDPPSPPLPPDLASAEALRQRLEALKATLGPEERVNLTDADARVMPSRHGSIAGFNAQAVAAPLDEAMAGTTGLLVTAADVTSAADDHDQLLPMLTAAEQSTGQRASISAADGGYRSVDVLAACQDRNQLVLLPEPQPRPSTKPYAKSQFIYDSATDTFRCPEGQTLRFVRRTQRTNRPPARVYRATAAICRACPAVALCTKDERKGRVLEVTEEHPLVRAHRALMALPEAQRAYAQRKELIEPIFGILRETQGLQRFLLRGLEQVRAEWALLTAAFNLRTLARIWQGQPGLLTA